jgi:hypothetical protein
MQEPYSEGVANHACPESCGVARKGGAEALTGGSAGRILSREKPCFGTLTPWPQAEGNIHRPQTRGAVESRAVADPAHARTQLVRESGGPVFAQRHAPWDVSGSPRT